MQKNGDIFFRKFNKFYFSVTVLIILFLIGYAPFAFASSLSNVWSQTDWSGGYGQLNWSDVTKYLDDTGIDFYDVPGQISLQLLVKNFSQKINDFIGGSFHQTHIFSSADNNNNLLALEEQYG
jgi:hypothetical protein